MIHFNNVGTRSGLLLNLVAPLFGIFLHKRQHHHAWQSSQEILNNSLAEDMQLHCKLFKNNQLAAY
jgi:hypothetical protein